MVQICPTLAEIGEITQKIGKITQKLVKFGEDSVKTRRKSDCWYPVFVFVS